MRRVLTLKERLGLFDDPYRAAARSASRAARRQHRELAREAARRSIVLLENRGGLLPFRDAPRAARRRRAARGRGRRHARPLVGRGGRPRDTVTLLDGIRAALPDERNRARARASRSTSDDGSGIPAALDASRDADLVLLCLGEAAVMSGEAASRGLPDLPGRQAELARAVLDLGKPVVVLLSCGRPLRRALALRARGRGARAWFLGNEAGNAVGDILSGRARPGRPPAGHLAGRPRADPDLLQPAPYRPAADPRERYTSRYLDLPMSPCSRSGTGCPTRGSRWGPRASRPRKLWPGGTAAVEVEVRNEGEVAGETTVLLFVHGPATYPARRVLELRGMARLGLPAGGRGTVRLAVSADDLATPGPDLAPTLVPGEYELLVGFSAEQKGLLAARLRLGT